MGNGSYNNHHHTIHHHHHHHFHQKSIFWPMLCRLSIKDIKLDNHCKDRIRAEEEPRSPKVSCMGQVKRNNRVIGYSTAAAAAVNHHHKYTKLKKLFSSKALMGPATGVGAPSANVRTRSRSCRANGDMCLNNSTKLKLKNHSGPINGVDRQNCVKVVINVGEMDPPLPVVKKAAPPPGIGRDKVNLWKRRFNNGGGLKSLQIDQQTHCQVQAPTTV